MFPRLLRNSIKYCRFSGKNIPRQRISVVRFQSTSSKPELIIENVNSIKTTINPNILELRVGLIKEIRRHENADSLYVSQIQIGPKENDIAQVCSGLVGLVPLEELDGRRVIVVNNLKPSKMRGIKSEAMLLCADGGVSEVLGSESKPIVEPVTPPKDSLIGNTLSFVNSKASDAVKDIENGVWKRIKSKAFQEVSEDLSVDDKLRVVWRQEWVLCDKSDISNFCSVKNSALVGAQVR